MHTWCRVAQVEVFPWEIAIRAASWVPRGQIQGRLGYPRALFRTLRGFLGNSRIILDIFYRVTNRGEIHTVTINEGKESGTIIHGVRGTVTVMNEVMESTTMNELKESPAITNEVKE